MVARLTPAVPAVSRVVLVLLLAVPLCFGSFFCGSDIKAATAALSFLLCGGAAAAGLGNDDVGTTGCRFAGSFFVPGLLCVDFRCFVFADEADASAVRFSLFFDGLSDEFWLSAPVVAFALERVACLLVGGMMVEEVVKIHSRFKRSAKDSHCEQRCEYYK